MAETITIEKSPTLEKSQDYAFLRQAGIAHLQALGSNLWTDYNVHDPGVTILEMLCYAITDLGYRTSYDIEDVLGLEEGERYFHTARNILTVNPVTVNDWRKLLMDVEGVRNAWLVPAETNEIPIYLDGRNGVLTYTEPKESEKSKRERLAAGKPHPSQLMMGGLYNVRIEFEEDDEYGDLNDPVLKRTVTIDGKDDVVSFTFPTWQSLLETYTGQLQLLRDFLDRGRITSIVVDAITFDADAKGYNFDLSIEFEYLADAPTPDPGFLCKTPCEPPFETDYPMEGFFDVPAIPKPYVLDNSDPKLLNGKLSGLRILARYPGRADRYENLVKELLQDNAEVRLIEFYRQKIDFTLDIVDRVWCTLHEHRNLCEDFLDIDSLKTEEVAVCAEIEIKPDANVDKVMAEILHQIDTFISPPVNFYTIQQLFDQGLTSDQIFNGPALNHGFIKEEELDLAILKGVIHTSDLINIIMDVEGVMAVRTLEVANYIDGVPQTKGEAWTLNLQGDGLHVPKLSEEKSKIIFFKDLLPYRADMDEVSQYVAELRLRDRKGRLKETELDLEAPLGVEREIGVYSTIQNQFPVAYGTTHYGIPGSPNALRKAQAKQLKAFLLFFEQTLANYLAQLDHVKDLLSIRATSLGHSYYTQPVTDPKGIEDLLMAYSGINGFTAVEQQVQRIAEDKDLYEERKNRFLDHLLARFAESFADYSLLMYALRDDKAGSELIEDKLKFLEDYPAVSGERGKGFNYRPTRDCKFEYPHALWNTYNVVGLKKRVARLLGMEDYSRRNLTGHMFALYENVYTQRPNTWVWRLHDISDKDASPLSAKRVLLQSLEYETREEANYMITYAIAMVEMGKLVIDNKQIIDRSCCNRVGVDDLLSNPPVGTPYIGIILKNLCDDVIACGPEKDSLQDAARDHTVAYQYVMQFCNLENFHVIEHVLLRPRIKDQDNLLPICVEPIPDTTLTDLSPEYYQDVDQRWRFRIRWNQIVLLRSQASFKTFEGVKEEFALMNDLRKNRSSIEKRKSVDDRYYFVILDEAGEVRASSHLYPGPVELDRAIKLLSGGRICSEFADPYTFRVSVILPSWAGRFRDINFRRMVEKTLRSEAPAHVFLRICWIDRDQMAEFECHYRCWLLELGKLERDPAQLSLKLNGFIDKLFALENIYPLATLHGCDGDSGSDSQVVLDLTSLGTL